MNATITTILLISLPLLIFLLFLWLRLIRVMSRNIRAGKSEEKPGRNLLIETLHEQAIREKQALELSRESTLALEALNALHRTIMTHLPLNVLVLTRDARIQYANPYFMDLMDLQQVTGQHLSEISEDLYHAYARLKANAINFQDTISLEIKGETRRLNITLNSLPEDRLLFTLVDQTRLFHLEEQVRYKRELELMGEMAGGVTHEVKNALAVIQGRVQLMARGDAPVHSAEIMKEIQRLLRFIQDFMNSSKNESPELVPVPAASWFEEMTTYWDGHPQGLYVVFHQPPPNLSIRGDQAQLNALLRNLILNGLQASEQTDANPRVSVLVEDLPDATAIIVEDSGPGFSPDIRKKIFVPFVTSKEEGSGLGLFHCRKIMMEHGGRLEIIHDPPTRIKCLFPKAVG